MSSDEKVIHSANSAEEIQKAYAGKKAFASSVPAKNQAAEAGLVLQVL
ncbi:hypothetical protein SAMN05443252_102323 [Bacillus sp. OV322]|nr:hypothetical protein SAMN05443252_102323 [Bacillus sp. OV322]